MISDILTILSIFSGALALGFITGARIGYKRGRDEQWVDSFIQRNNRERERRDKDGRFKSKTK